MRGKTLFIIPGFDENLPRNERIYNILKHADHPEDYEIICFEGKFAKRSIEGVNIRRLKMSFISRWILNREFSGVVFPSRILKRIAGLLNLIYRKFVVVDNWVFETDNILKNLKFEHFDAIVLVVSPFSNYILCYKIKNYFFPSCKIILDIGDPFYKNSGIHKSNRQIYYKVESKALLCADQIIITNKSTFNFFKNVYNFSRNIRIIPNGFNSGLIDEKNEITIDFNYMNLIYAGATYDKLRPIEFLINALNKLSSTQIYLSIFGSNLTEKTSFIAQYKRVEFESLVKEYKKHNLLVFIDNAFGIQSSSKIFELLALKQPILFLYTYESETFKICSKFEWVFFVKNELNEIITFFEKYLNFRKSITIDSKELPLNMAWEIISKKYLTELRQY